MSTGPIATVPPRSRTRPAASFESATAKYASQSTAIGREEATAPRLATGMPWAVAVDHSSPIGEGANSQPSTCP